MSKWVILASWEDVPHLSESEKHALRASISPHELEARSKGIPAVGAGAIYPVPESTFLTKPFSIPHHWPRMYGLDVGWNRTAAVWGALDEQSDTIYLYSEYYAGRAEPAIHAAAIKARGDWIPGVIDPAAVGRNQMDGRSFWDEYLRLGLNISKANNALDAGIQKTWQRLSTGRLKIFSNLANTLSELRVYRYNKHGKVDEKQEDHAMDAMRYLVMSGLDVAVVEPMYLEEEMEFNTRQYMSGRDPIGGY